VVDISVSDQGVDVGRQMMVGLYSAIVPAPAASGAYGED